MRGSGQAVLPLTIPKLCFDRKGKNRAFADAINFVIFSGRTGDDTWAIFTPSSRTAGHRNKNDSGFDIRD
jgi:hypothetical protein